MVIRKILFIIKIFVVVDSSKIVKSYVFFFLDIFQVWRGWIWLIQAFFTQNQVEL